MNTRCLIAIAKDDHYLSICCHRPGRWPDPAPYYTTELLAARLIVLGDLSYLQTDKAHTYHGGHGDAWAQTQPRRSTSESQLLALAGACDAQYLYIFQTEGWISRQLTL